MPRVGFNLIEETAQKLKQFAVKKTDSMKGLSQVGEEAFKEYLEKFVVQTSDSDMIPIDINRFLELNLQVIQRRG